MTNKREQKPTTDEAIRIIVQAPSDKYRRQCLDYWRNRYGERFADEVRTKSLEQIKNKKMQGVRDAI